MGIPGAFRGGKVGHATPLWRSFPGPARPKAPARERLFASLDELRMFQATAATEAPATSDRPTSLPERKETK